LISEGTDLPSRGEAPSIFAAALEGQIGLITEVDVMSPVVIRTLAAGAVMLLTVSGATRAQSVDEPVPTVGSPNARVRGLDPSARHILQRAAEGSPTIVRMLGDLESTDLMVGIETAHLPRFLNGEVRVVAATASVRYLRVRLNVPRGDDDLVAVLGHELRHALEIAGMQDVRNASALVSAYQRIGTKGHGDGYYETEAALEAGRTVAKELGEHRRFPSRVTGHTPAQRETR
jgi:hypothetical protein